MSDAKLKSANEWAMAMWGMCIDASRMDEVPHSNRFEAVVEAIRAELGEALAAELRALGIASFKRTNADAFDRAYGESAAYHHAANFVETFGVEKP